MNVFQIVRAKVKNEEILDIDLQIAIDEISEVIKNYCNLEIIPEGLKYTHANMAVDLALYENERNKSIDVDGGIDIADVSSLKVGDTQMSLDGGQGQRSKILKSHQANLDTLTFNYKQQLNRYRKMVW